jgi:RNA 3'-terminal phosphate cyclase (ATP)
MVVLDGSMGEGGGQVLRTALAASLLTGEPFRILQIRARRARPGLGRQHLAAVQAAAEVGRAEVEGAHLGSLKLTFWPRGVRGGKFRWEVGSAGSASLVLQAVLVPLVAMGQASLLEITGGTHNPQAPPFEFLQQVLLPTLGKMGAKVKVTLEGYGFYPAGGGKLVVSLEEGSVLRPLELLERGALLGRKALALYARLPQGVAERELRVVRQRLGFAPEECEARLVSSPGPGNALLLALWGEGFAEVVSAFGRKGLPAEKVAEEAVGQLERFLALPVPVGEHLADQLLLPLAWAGGGRFRTLPLSSHARTVIEVIKAFLPVEVLVSCLPSGVEEVEVVAGSVA